MLERSAANPVFFASLCENIELYAEKLRLPYDQHSKLVTTDTNNSEEPITPFPPDVFKRKRKFLVDLIDIYLADAKQEYDRLPHDPNDLAIAELLAIRQDINNTSESSTENRKVLIERILFFLAKCSPVVELELGNPPVASEDRLLAAQRRQKKLDELWKQYNKKSQPAPSNTRRHEEAGLSPHSLLRDASLLAPSPDKQKEIGIGAWLKNHWKGLLFWGLVGAGLAAFIIFTSGAAAPLLAGAAVGSIFAGGGSAFSALGIGGCIGTMLGGFTLGAAACGTYVADQPKTPTPENIPPPSSQPPKRPPQKASGPNKGEHSPAQQARASKSFSAKRSALVTHHTLRESKSGNEEQKTGPQQATDGRHSPRSLSRTKE